ncbi:MAG TPA: tetratricopeptide repeat protein [Steroidobacteraceae bacterium]|nr:tetratricopeptide repeat protein [Steroidobacteraceae bacterium]
MTTFIVIAGLMIIAALAIVLVPLLRARPRKWSAVMVAGSALPVLAVLGYSAWSNWSWQGGAGRDGSMPPIEIMLEGLEAKLRANPTDVAGWLLLGRSNFQLQRYPQAAEAYQQAYTLTEGKNVEATLGLGEALAFSDERMLTARSAQLFERAMELAPNHPKALWYSGLAAYQTRNFDVARERWARLVALEPPAEVKRVLQDKIAEIDAGLGSPMPSRPEAAAASNAVVKVRVGIAPELAAKVPQGAPLFVMVRGDAGGGPPLAVTRRTAEQFPQLVELSDRDAMIAGRGISSASRVTVVARVARSGDPRPQSGDLEGQVGYDVGDGKTVDLVINSILP